MAAFTHFFIATLILLISFLPHPFAGGAWIKSPQSRGSADHRSIDYDNPFRDYPQLKKSIARLEKKSLTVAQHAEIAREVIEEVGATGNELLKFHAYIALLDFGSIQVDLELCKDLLRLAGEVDEKVDAPKLTAKFQYLEAKYRNKVGEYRESIELVKKAQSSNLLSERDFISSNLVMGVSCERLGLLEQSFVAFQRVVARKELNNRGRDVRIAKSNVATMLVKMKKYKKAAAVLDEIGPLSPSGLVYIRVTLGRCEIALSKNDINTALELSQKAIDVCKIPNGKISNWGSRKKRSYVGLLYLMQARCYLKREDFLPAQRLCEKAIKLLEETPHRMYEARAFLGCIIAKRGRPEVGIEMVQESFKAAEAAEHIYSTLAASEKLTKLYEDNGQLEEAFAQFKVTEEIENSMKVEDWELKLELAESQHQAKLEEQRVKAEERTKTRQAVLVAANAISQAEKSKTIQYGIGLALALTLLSSAGYLVSQSRRKKTQNLLFEARERVEHQEQLAQKKRIEDVGKLTVGVAHDFNNFLQIICQINFLLEDSLGKQMTSIQEKLFQNEDNAVAVASKITEQLLTYAKRQATAPKVALIAPMLESTLSLLGSDRDSVQIDVLEFDQTLAINVDKQQFSNAVLNLLLNARDSMNGTGVIKLRIGEQTMSKPNSLQLPAGDYVRIEVSDSGKGMDDEQLRRACEPFFSTKSPTTGTGLGLSSVKGFVEQAGGAIELKSTLGLDATVSLYFPKAGAAEDLYQSVKSDFNVVSTTERVCLVVEDNPIVRSTFELMLKSCGYESTSCCCADDAYDILKKEHRFSLVLSDIRMPGNWDGIDLAKWIRETSPEIQVVLISGNDAPSDLKQAAFLRKPFQLKDLQSILEINTVHQ